MGTKSHRYDATVVPRVGFEPSSPIVPAFSPAPFIFLASIFSPLLFPFALFLPLESDQLLASSDPRPGGPPVSSSDDDLNTRVFRLDLDVGFGLGLAPIGEEGGECFSAAKTDGNVSTFDTFTITGTQAAAGPTQKRESNSHAGQSQSP